MKCIEGLPSQVLSQGEGSQLWALTLISKLCGYPPSHLPSAGVDN